MERRKGVVIIFSIRGRTDCTCWPSLASSVASVRTFTIFPADVQPLLDSFFAGGCATLPDSVLRTLDEAGKKALTAV